MTTTTTTTTMMVMVVVVGCGERENEPPFFFSPTEVRTLLKLLAPVLGFVGGRVVEREGGMNGLKLAGGREIGSRGFFSLLAAQGGKGIELNFVEER